jgi:tRNA threonylcarbamoyl adenosine modification protein YeaZ
VKQPLVLSVSTSGPVAAALVDGNREFAATSDRQALEGTLPCIKDVLAAGGAQLRDIGLLAACIGPGSFTGLRIGVALAKTISQSLGIPIVGVAAYDVAEFGAGEEAYPRVAIVRGKTGYYYARIARRRDDVDFARGSEAELQNVLAGARRFPLDDVPAGERALRVARLARATASLKGAADWCTLSIDYGQLPNAVVNWRSRR